MLFDRHKSIIAYLAANNLPNAAAALREEVGLGEDVYDAATEKKYETLLEKKWTSIVRLQKKVRIVWAVPFWEGGIDWVQYSPFSLPHSQLSTMLSMSVLSRQELTDLSH